MDWISGIAARLIQPLLTFYREHERIAGPLFFLGGVTYDSLTISRIDRWFDNLLLLGYLGVLGGLIVVVGLVRRGRLVDTRWNTYVRIYPYVIQFLLGGLLSAYTIYYFQSTSLSTSSIFLTGLIGLLVANEFLEDRLMNLPLLFALYTFVCFSFFLYFVPVVLGTMGYSIFALSVLCTTGAIYATLYLIAYPHTIPEVPECSVPGLVSAGMIALLVVLYLLNWIPPIPLSMEWGGVYHEVQRQGDVFVLTYASPPFYRFWEHSESPFLYRQGDRVYCFTSVFAPTDLQLTLYHQWQYYAGEEKGWVTTDRIGYDIRGGRHEGYRAYTVKQHIDPGLWRVNVYTPSERLIGRVQFEIQKTERQEIAMSRIRV